MASHVLAWGSIIEFMLTKVRDHLRQKLIRWQTHQSTGNPRRRQINASLNPHEYRIIARAAKAAGRSPALQLKLMALAFARNHHAVAEDFAPVVQELRQLRSMAEDLTSRTGQWFNQRRDQKSLAARIDQWEDQLRQFLNL